MAEGTASVEATPERDVAAEPSRVPPEAWTRSEPETGPETPAAAPTGPEPRTKSGPGFFTLLLGGLIAGVIGYGLAYYTEFRPFAASEDPTETLAADVESQAGEIEQAAGRLETLAGRVDQQSGQLTDLSDSVTSMQTALTDLQDNVAGLQPAEGGVPQETLDELRAAADEGVSGLADQIAEMSSRLDSLSSRVDELSAQGGERGAQEALSQYEEQLNTLQQQLDSQRDQIAKAEEQAASVQQNAEQQSRAVTARAALTRMQAAIEGGSPFAAALGDLSGASEAQIPEALQANAETGVATVPELQRRFPDAARAALDAARAANAAEGGAMDRMMRFLQTQTGARALQAQEGDSPNAVLSRAGAALEDGDLGATLDELQALPEAGREAMSSWLEAAQARQDAIAALDQLASGMNTN